MVLANIDDYGYDNQVTFISIFMWSSKFIYDKCCVVCHIAGDVNRKMGEYLPVDIS